MTPTIFTTAILGATILFETGWGTGPYDVWKYGYYESEVLLFPERTMIVSAMEPKIFSCLGECVYELAVSEGEVHDQRFRGLDGASDVIATHTQRGQRLVTFDGTLTQPILLSAGKTYRIAMRISSSKGEVGIYTAGGAPFPNRRGPVELLLLTARKGSKRYTERGPMAFTLRGVFLPEPSSPTLTLTPTSLRHALLQVRVQARRERRLQQRKIPLPR